MKITIDKKYHWKHAESPELKYWHIGSEKAVNRFISFCRRNPAASSKELSEELYNNAGHYAVIVEQENRLMAAVDKIRSYPIFYVQKGETFAVSNSARALKNEYNLSEIDELSLLEFRMAGYVTGRETLFQHLYQLQAGEFLIRDKAEAKIERERYYLFYSEEVRDEKEEVLIEELDEITDKIFYRVIEEANGAPIWVPLSGGLDSRLVLCKLKQLGYDNLTAFSYGPPGNYEAKAAQYVAKQIGVPWRFVPLGMRESRDFFYSDTRKAYWEFSDGLCSIPNMQDIHALAKLGQEKILPSETVIINGQSGDFITGGHIPDTFLNHAPDMALLLDRAFEKHLSQWLNLKTEENLKKIENKILSILKIDNRILNTQELSSRYECWEWQERQCKYVVNGQRIYDFLDIRWCLPLWDEEYLRFWPSIPLSLKYGQRLYKAYLDHFDFYECFKNVKPKIWRWPGWTLGVVPVARLIKLLFGKRYSDLFYSYFKYIGHYRQFYAPYNLKDVIKKTPKIRGPISLNIETWLEENLLEKQ
ncbi:MAG: asparagine synthase-related protein [bacterium]